MNEIRIGYGYDVHALVQDETLILGGVKIPHIKGTVAHSDGDVLIHALCDALLGTLALGDIGLHFPDTDQAYKNADSRVLLKKVYLLISERGYRLVNADMTIAMQQPKLRPHIDAMRVNIAEILDVNIECISVKATTTEKLGFEGREEGVSAYAAVLIQKK